MKTTNLRSLAWSVEVPKPSRRRRRGSLESGGLLVLAAVAAILACIAITLACGHRADRQNQQRLPRMDEATRFEYDSLIQDRHMDEALAATLF
ncbi:MAG: hypothetical protein O3A51_11115 [Verrucomicrobia bacterium]|nr:hypothetical protein [Verrucomicrobiota bacterium]